MEEEEPTASTSQLGTLALTGVVRGAPISANRLVHLQGFGDFQVVRVSRCSHVDYISIFTHSGLARLSPLL